MTHIILKFTIVSIYFWVKPQGFVFLKLASLDIRASVLNPILLNET